MSDKVLELNDETFEAEALKSELPVLVDFWAEWCMPCKALAPTVEQMAEEYDGKVKFRKVNIDQARQVAAKYFIRGIPNLILFKAGEVAGQLVGFQKPDSIRALLNKHL